MEGHGVNFGIAESAKVTSKVYYIAIKIISLNSANFSANLHRPMFFYEATTKMLQTSPLAKIYLLAIEIDPQSDVDKIRHFGRQPLFISLIS
jgi:hypothetical protein